MQNGTIVASNAKWLKKVRWDEHGLVPVIAQEAGSNDVLMFAWMNRDALARTVELGEAVYWSRSRKKLWHKGEESGHTQKVLEIRLDPEAITPGATLADVRAKALAGRGTKG